jgi:hypothetical protein
LGKIRNHEYIRMEWSRGMLVGLKNANVLLYLIVAIDPVGFDKLPGLFQERMANNPVHPINA